MAGRSRAVPRALLGLVVALVILGLLVSVIGWRAVVAELATANVPALALGVGLVVAAFASWSETLRRLLSGRRPRPGDARYRLAFLSGEFTKQVLPLGHTAGPALMAYPVSRVEGATYEETFAATVVTEFVNIGASILLATTGMVVLVSRRPGDPLLVALAGGLALACAGVFAVGILVHYRRGTLRWLVRGVAGLVGRTLGRASVTVRTAVAPAAIDARFESFYASLDRVAADRRRVAGAGVFALVGWSCFVLPLVTSFAALGYRLPIPIALFAVPVVGLVNVVPLPGGLGGFELALIAVVAGVTGIDPAASAAGVLLYRTSTYWLLLLAGGLATAYLSVSRGDAANR